MTTLQVMTSAPYNSTVLLLLLSLPCDSPPSFDTYIIVIHLHHQNSIYSNDFLSMSASTLSSTAFCLHSKRPLRKLQPAWHSSVWELFQKTPSLLSATNVRVQWVFTIEVKETYRASTKKGKISRENMGGYWISHCISA